MGNYDFSEEAAQTDEELSGALANLGVLDDSKISELLPAQSDQDELRRLVGAVNQATSENEKKAILSEQIGAVSEVVKNVVLKVV